MSAQAAKLTEMADIQLVTMRIQGQLLGISVHDVREILRNQHITKIPLVHTDIAGALNLRGRIVTVFDMQSRLQLPPRETIKQLTFVVVEHKADLYSLVVDSVGDVLTIPSDGVHTPPPNLSATWRDLSSGVYKLEKELLVILDPKRLFEFK